MKISYDGEVDALSITFLETTGLMGIRFFTADAILAVPGH